MDELRRKMRDLELKHTGLLACGKEEEAANVYQAMCDIQNQMERIGDAAFDKAHS